MKILVTGCAGFIGFHFCNLLLNKNINIIGVDNLNNYYDINLKKKRLEILKKNKKFNFYLADIKNIKKLKSIFKKNKISHVVHLAAQAGVRYSLKSPESYISTNLNGFFNIINLSRLFKVKHFVYASTSSVYGSLKNTPFKESQSTDHPIQLYAATKKSNEIMAHAFSQVYNLPTTGLRFFTVYGPWGRPDMALFLFTKRILQKKSIDVFNYGKHIRDFTYVDDIVNGIFKALKNIPKKNNRFNFYKPKLGESDAPYQIYNLGNSKPIKLMDYIIQIEKNLKIKAKKKYLPLQIGDIKETHSDIKKSRKKLRYNPKTSIKTGVKNFVDWYINYKN